MAEMPAALVSRAIYGRERVIERIDSTLDQAAEGHGLTLLLSCEAGIGKSRLSARTQEVAAARGWHTLGATVYEQDKSYPNTVLIELLGAYFAAAPETAQGALAPAAADVARLLPAFPGTTAGASEGDSDRRQLFTVAASAITGYSAGAPLLISVEDLHWADDASLDFLIVLARSIAAVPAVLLLTYRNDEVGPALSRFLVELDRERLARELRLERLDRQQVEAMLRDILGRPSSLRPDFAHALHSRSDGNPFFVEEMVRSMLPVEQGASLEAVRLDELPIPRSVQEAVQSRAASLSPAAQRLLEIAAVIGVRFDFELLGAVCGLGDGEMLTQIKELIAHQLVMEEGEDVFVFRHALTGQAITAALLSRERRELHARVLEALEQLRGHEETALDQLAYHAYAAAEWVRALDYLTRAGRRALGLYAPAAALDDFNRAFEAASHLEPLSLARLYYDRAVAHDALSDFDRARRDYEQAIAAADDAELAWQATLNLGLLWSSRDYRAAFDCYTRAVELAEGLGDEAMARSLMRLGNWYANTGDFSAARRNIEEALAMFRALGDRHAEAEALDVLGMACIMGAVLPEGARFYREAIPLLEASRDRRTLASTLGTIGVAAGTYQTDILVPAMALAEGLGYVERSLDLARSTGVRQDESYALWQLSFILGPMGEYGRALHCAREALSIAEDLQHEQWVAASHIALGAILLDTLQLDEAQRHLEKALAMARQMNSEVWIAQATEFLPAVYAAQQRSDLALQMFDSAERPAGDDMTARWREAGRAVALLHGGRVEEALALVETLRALAQPGRGQVILRLDWLRARGVRSLGRRDEAIVLLQSLVPAALAHGHRSLLWRIHADLASALLEAGDRDGARGEAEAALDLIEALAATLDDEGIADAYRQQAQAVMPASLRRRSRSNAGLLTEREAEIAALIARGMSNRAIADELVLSARTVETHVANALTKLGFGSRSQLAAWSVDQAKRSKE